MLLRFSRTQHVLSTEPKSTQETRWNESRGKAHVAACGLHMQQEYLLKTVTVPIVTLVLNRSKT